jgi:signal transduction histidine kinase
MNSNPQPDAKEISGVLSRVNHLGKTTERLFSRLYTGLSQRSQQEDAEREQIRRAKLQKAIDGAHRLTRQNLQLKMAVQRREQEIDNLTGILAAIDEGIIMQNMEGRILFMNRAAQDMLGGHKNFWETELGTLFDAYREFMTTDSELTPLGQPTQVQVNHRVLGAQVAAVGDGAGHRLGTMIVLRDVTRDALAERLKNQFILGISHELNTPMTVIKGVSELLAGQPEDQPANRRFLEKLTHNVDILNGMVVELLDLSEMGAGNFTIRDDVLNLEPLIWSVVKGKMPEINRAKVKVMFRSRDMGRLYVKGDNERLRWALGHLIQNSARYNEPGGKITVSATLENDNHVAIEVSDTGVGISNEDLPHIFERFYRGAPRTSGGKLIDARGLGQGLFVARTVTEAHGGYLRMHSELHRGSVFTIVLPTARE